MESDQKRFIVIQELFFDAHSPSIGLNFRYINILNIFLGDSLLPPFADNRHLRLVLSQILASFRLLIPLRNQIS